MVGSVGAVAVGSLAGTVAPVVTGDSVEEFNSSICSSLISYVSVVFYYSGMLGC